jgi:hypothetical protein
MIPFFSRSTLTAWAVAVGLEERQQRQADFAADGFELFSLPVVKPRMYREPRDLSTLHRIVTHVTAVRGGFGVRKSRVRHWTDHIVNGRAVSTPLWGDLGYPPDPVRLALWERYRAAVPYHQIGAANGDNVANRELEHHTWHATKGNDGVGWALDVGATEDLDNWHVETGRASLRTLCARVLKASAKAQREGILVAPHRAFSPHRRGDTGANVHREVVIPVARGLDCLEIDYTVKRGRGRPIPRSWDPVATHDERGRKV